VYRQYWLALPLWSPRGCAAIRTDADLRKWLPGDGVFDGSVYVPETLKPGRYRVYVGLLDPRSAQPAIRLAIEGRQSHGWYGRGEIAVE
jgi:hypothetical protein